MNETVTLICRVDSLNGKSYIDKQVATVLANYKKNLKGRRSDLTLVSDIERKYLFHRLSAEDAKKLKSIAKENKTKICMKSVSIGSDESVTPPSPPPPSPVLVVPSPTISTASLSSSSMSSVSSGTKSLVLNFGIGDSTTSSGPSPSSTTTGNSFFSSDSDTTTNGVGVGTAITTPETLLLRELANIMKVESIKPTPSQIGKAVSTWFVSENVQKVMRRIV